MDEKKLPVDEVIEMGKEAQSMRGVFLKIIGVSLIPLVIMGLAIYFLSSIRFRHVLEEEIRGELRTAAYELGQHYEMIDRGDYHKDAGGNIIKGSETVNGKLAGIGRELQKSGIYCSFFYGDTRVDTTVIDSAGNVMIGTKLDVGIYKKLHDTGEELFCESANLGNRTYYGYYIPYRNSDGEVTAIFFAGKLRSEVFERIRAVSSSILWTILVVLVIGTIVSLLCTIYMVGYIFKHLRSEQDLNIKKASTRDQLDFMTLVSREVRDPMDSVTILSDRILEGQTSDDIRDKALGIKEAANSMLISFNSIFDYSRLEAGDIELSEDEYNITDLVDGCCAKVAPGIERKKLKLEVNYVESMPKRLMGDYAKIRQILDNLLENAVKYTFEGGITLDISYRNITADKIDVTFSVKDTGTGIRKDDAEKLFYSIGKVGESKNVSIKGTGLGLLICKRLVSVLDGRISVDSEIGKGSTFKFTVPQDVINRRAVGRS